MREAAEREVGAAGGCSTGKEARARLARAEKTGFEGGGAAGRGGWCQNGHGQKEVRWVLRSAVGDRFRGSRELIVSLPVFSSYAGTKQRTTSPFPEKCPRNPEPKPKPKPQPKPKPKPKPNYRMY